MSEKEKTIDRVIFTVEIDLRNGFSAGARQAGVEIAQTLLELQSNKGIPGTHLIEVIGETMTKQARRARMLRMS